MGKAHFKNAAIKPMIPPAVSVDDIPVDSLKGVTITKAPYKGEDGVYITGAVYTGHDSHKYYEPGEKNALARNVAHQVGEDGYPLGGTKVHLRPKF